MSESLFPADIEIGSQETGILGETILKEPYAPPEPILRFLKKWYRENIDNDSKEDDLHIKNRSYQRMFVVEQEGEEMKWLCDYLIEISHKYKFPVEVKTGGGKLDYGPQREVMELVSTMDDTQSILVNIEIDGLPDTYSIQSVKTIGGD